MTGRLANLMLREGAMPVNRKKMKALKKEYGAKKGEDIYYAMENKAKHSTKRSKGKRKGR